MKLNDEQLDDLLRQVDIPGGLKASLLSIPDRDLSVEAGPTSKSWTTLLSTVAALAASVVLYFTFAPNLGRPNDILVADAGSNEVEVEMLLAELQQEMDTLDSMMQLQEANLDVELSTEPIYDIKESVATALSLSWQSAIDRGASVDSVRNELQYVVDQYPETAGAHRAQGLLQIN